MVEVVRMMLTSFQRSRPGTTALNVPDFHQATTNPHLCLRLLDTHRWVWVSLLCGRCSFFLGLGAHKVLFVPSKSLFLQSCVRSGCSMVGLMVTSSMRAYAISRFAAPRAPAPAADHCWPVLLQGDTQTHFCLSLCGVSASWCTQGLFEPSVCLWWVWGLILNMIQPLLPSYWVFSFALGHGVSFFGMIQHSSIDGCSEVSCNFGVLTREDEHMSFYSTILMSEQLLQHINLLN